MTHTSPAHDIAMHLQAVSVSTFGSIGSRVHVSMLPDKPDEVLALFDRGGPGPDPRNLAEEVAVQILIRSTGFREAYDLAWKVRDELLGAGPVVLNGKRYDTMWLEGDVILTGHDSRNRVQLSMNVRAWVFPPSGKHRD